MIITTPLWTQKAVTYYRKLLILLRLLPEGAFYTLSLSCALLIGWAGAVGSSPTYKIEAAFEVFFVLHFALCVRLGLSITNNIKPMSKLGWLMGLSAFCIAIFSAVFEPSSTQFMKFVISFIFLVVVFFSLGFMISTAGEKQNKRAKKATKLEKIGQVVLVLIVGVLIAYSHLIGEHIAYMLKDVMGIPR